MFVFRISKPGIDVLANPQAKDLVLDSELNHLKTFSYGSFQQTVSPYTVYNFIINHNLGYYPLALGYYRVLSTPDRWYICYINPDITLTYRYFTNVDVGIAVNQTQLIFKVYSRSSQNETIEVNYEVFYEGV